MTQIRIPPQAVVFITTATVIYSLGYRLHTFTAVPRSTQPSTLVVKWISASGVSHSNKWRCWMQTTATFTGRLGVQARSFRLKVGSGHSMLSLHSSNRVNCRITLPYWQQHKHYDAIIVRKHHSTMYVNVACCYRPSSVVCWSVCQSVTLLSPAKMA